MDPKKLLRSRWFYQGVFVSLLGLLAIAFPASFGGSPASQAVAWLFGALGFVIVALGIDDADAVRALRQAVHDAQKGVRPARPAESGPEVAEVYDALGSVASAVQQLRGEREELSAAVNELEGDLDKARAEAADPAELQQVERERQELQREIETVEAKLREAIDAVQRSADASDRMRERITGAEAVVAQQVEKLSAGFGEQMAAVDQTIDSMQSISVALNQISQNVETLASNAEESSSSILEMTATNDEVAENMANLANSVRETVSSIEEMTYSIKEVARNVDALSLTAEETSSSMNQMDVSIDQVQSNAYETARLSEEVAVDAEKGAESILKTIQEINRIKETSLEAVTVIGSLGGRIEAIGEILNVIDDVAEQTNLLALNAAIIAAQAGEHGKGFAVVADEIKDLAERAGASTKEIADLIKTIQAESKRGITAVEVGAATVDRGVEVSAEAERALKKILGSSQKSTSMVRAIARATVEQAKGSKQVTDAIGRIAETVQQIAAATAEQARGSELIMKSAEKMRLITQHVERSSQEQARGGRQISQAIENISGMVNELHQSQRMQARSSEQTIAAARRIQELTRAYEGHVRELSRATEQLREASAE